MTPGASNRVIRIALLCDFTSHQLLPPLRVLLNQARLSAEIWEAPFGTINTEALDPNSSLHLFQADVIVIVSAVQALRAEYYGVGADKSDFPSTTIARFQSLWQSIRRNANAWIVQANFVDPYESFFGQFDGRVENSFTTAVQTINRGLTAAAKTQRAVLLCDLAGIASYLGRRDWFRETL